MRLLHRLGILLVCMMLPWAAMAMELTEDTVYDPIPLEGAAPYAPHQEAYLPEQTGYHDDSLDVRVETFRRHDTTVMAVYVRLSDPSQLRTAMAAKPPSQKTMVVSSMAKKNNAVLAINGDYFSFHQNGIVVRSGKMWRNRPDGKRDILIIDENGDFTILPQCEKEDFAGYAGTVMHAFCFGPGLVVDGKALTSLEHADVGNAPAKATQRIALGQTGPLEYLIIATEGPENKGSVGFTILQMAELCQEMGCINAYNLDGGSSSSVVLGGKKINALSTGKIRPVGDCIYFATLIP
ncbi:MAG: phosphodiester glycosidase family protein [Eubacteriales bacterium]|nr:phosphodiester glycosidase family protein [Eubacteriales bacterium]